jgi:hypothetical protein
MTISDETQFSLIYKPHLCSGSSYQLITSNYSSTKFFAVCGEMCYVGVLLRIAIRFHFPT